MHKTLSAALVVSLSANAHAAPQTEFAWRCDFPTVQACTPAGCNTVAPTKDKAVWVFLSPEHRMYQRCVGKGFENCDRYTARVSDSGAFKVFELAGSGAFIKVAEDLSATEVVSIMNNVIIKRGKCETAPPPLVRTPTR